jgi:biotin transport system substrate-specific component
MIPSSFADGCRSFRYELFRCRDELNVTYRLVLSVLFAFLTGLSAIVRVYLPWSPVPVTAQTFVVLMSGVLLGRRYGAISQALYAGAGMICLSVFGSSWFAGDILFTGGYIVGFAIAAMFLGHFADKLTSSIKFLPMLGLMFFANFIIIYGLGVLQRAVVLGTFDLSKLLATGVLPYVPGVVRMVFLAASVAFAALPGTGRRAQHNRL